MMNNSSSVPSADPFTMPPRERWEIIVESLVAVGIAIFAIFGNVLIFVAFYRERTLRTIPNAFILSLAIADFLFGTTRLPMFIHTLFTGRWVFNHTTCLFQAFQGFNLFAVTLFTLSAISISRCCLIVYPIRYRVIFQEKNLAAIVGTIWVMSGLISSGPLFGWGIYKFDPKGSVCTFDHTSSPSYHIFTNALIQINVAIIVVCYTRIFLAVRAYKRRIQQRTGSSTSRKGAEPGQHEPGQHEPTSNVSDQRQRHEDMRITGTLLIVVCLFSLCWLPTAIISNVESRGVHLPRELRLFETMSIAMNSMLNPLVYGARCRKLRRTIIGVVTC